MWSLLRILTFFAIIVKINGEEANPLKVDFTAGAAPRTLTVELGEMMRGMKKDQYLHVSLRPSRMVFASFVKCGKVLQVTESEPLADVVELRDEKLEELKAMLRMACSEHEKVDSVQLMISSIVQTTGHIIFTPKNDTGRCAQFQLNSLFTFTCEGGSMNLDLNIKTNDYKEFSLQSLSILTNLTSQIADKHFPEMVVKEKKLQCLDTVKNAKLSCVLRIEVTEVKNEGSSQTESSSYFSFSLIFYLVELLFIAVRVPRFWQIRRQAEEARQWQMMIEEAQRRAQQLNDLEEDDEVQGEKQPEMEDAEEGGEEEPMADKLEPMYVDDERYVEEDEDDEEEEQSDEGGKQYYEEEEEVEEDVFTANHHFEEYDDEEEECEDEDKENHYSP